MRRILVFLRWQGDSWDSRETLRTDGQPEDQEGLTVYARSQAHIRRGLVAAFAEHWKRVLHLVASNSDVDPCTDDVDGVISLDAPPCEYIEEHDE
ncbi:uncharacterized protein F5147DRAFT_625706 [Suillus discolor]|uniref:Uncharacterized protein n=1 Tax=Suillus discolor TaxID=1912936 RepID=A0A9P7FJL4_9AGAM|nr:uncharacterized protein F5147DRAFT_625706 [Suillus discolor]KAG2118653.1 hypothetical protein F5147DRAFT_625706 [Suillus discolor]